MNKGDIEKIVHILDKECSKNFDKYKIDGYTLANKTTIPFSSKTINSRKVSDWGTDEDEDVIICYSSDGWERVFLTVQVGAGVQKIISQRTDKLSNKDIVEIFEKLDLINQAEFIHKAYEILQLSGYKSELI